MSSLWLFIILLFFLLLLVLIREYVLLRPLVIILLDDLLGYDRTSEFIYLSLDDVSTIVVLILYGYILTVLELPQLSADLLQSIDCLLEALGFEEVFVFYGY
jgi:hypothetical protein